MTGQAPAKNQFKKKKKKKKGKTRLRTFPSVLRMLPPWLCTPPVMTVQTDWHDYDNERLNKPLCQLPGLSFCL